MDTDLFGAPLEPPSAFRKDGRRRRIGYAAPPGTGPAHQRCGTCKFWQAVTHRGVTTHKCELMVGVWAHSSASDINLRAPACSEWERRKFEARPSPASN